MPALESSESAPSLAAPLKAPAAGGAARKAPKHEQQQRPRRHPQHQQHQQHHHQPRSTGNDDPNSGPSSLLLEPPTPEEAQRRGISLEGLLSIRHQQLVRKVKAAAGEHRRRLPQYCQRYKAGESVLSLAREADYPPYLLARMMVEELCLLPNRSKVTELMRAPALIGDARLRAEVAACIAQDGDFSPGADLVSRSLGTSYERELALRLSALAVPFEDEETLRARGLPKTPDARLLVPLGMVDREGKHVINWIDSKAMYGSRETYLTEVLPQVTRYVNRFGPGCVVFWFGFDDAIRRLPSTQHHHVVLLDDFPPRDGGCLVFLGGGAGLGGVR